jgi:hypothetical protein
MTDTGYIRMSYDQLQTISLVHLVSGVDEDGPLGAPDSASSTAISGYTEWISQGGLVITIGWDWQMLPENRGFHLKRICSPSSNLMLQSPTGDDLGPQKTAILLETFIDAFNWQSETLQYINIRYSN